MPHIRALSILIFVFSVSGGASAEVIAEHRGAYIKSGEVAESFPLEIADGEREYGISVTAILESGSGSLRVFDPDGQQVYQHLWSSRLSQERARLPVSVAGKYTITVELDGASGEWRARVVALPARAGLRWMYLSAALLIVVPVIALGTVRGLGNPLKFAALGGTMLLCGRVVWFAGAVALEISAKYALEDSMPYLAFLWMQSIVLGAWQGVAAALGVIAVVSVGKSIREKPSYVIAAGIGAGALEMIVTGLISLLGLAIMFGGGAKSDMAQFRQAYDMAVTPLLPLAEPLILTLTTVCYVAGTLLAVYGLRSKSAAAVLGGSAFFAAVLSAVSASRTITLFGPETRWVILAVLLPVAGLAYVTARRNLAAWRESPRAGESALDAFVREHDGVDD